MGGRGGGGGSSSSRGGNGDDDEFSLDGLGCGKFAALESLYLFLVSSVTRPRRIPATRQTLTRPTSTMISHSRHPLASPKNFLSCPFTLATIITTTKPFMLQYPTYGLAQFNNPVNAPALSREISTPGASWIIRRFSRVFVDLC